MLAFALVACLAAAPATLTLDEALAHARKHQPSLRQAEAQVAAAEARARQALAPLLPSAALSVGYSRSTANFVARPGAVPSSFDAASTPSLASYDYWNGSLTLSATLWDFGQGWHRWRASLSTAQAQAAQAQAQRRASDYAVRALYFAAASQRALAHIAQQALDNTAAHLAQVQATVQVGTRPEIDLAQARADHANARLALLTAQSAYTVGRARLNQAMGVDFPPSYEVEDPAAPEVPEEGQEAEALLPAALAARPEAQALEAQVRAQELTVRATRGAYLPSLGVQLGGTLASRALPTVVPNLSAQLTLHWALFEGGATLAKEREGEATLRQLEAQRDGLVLEARLGLQQALLDVAAAKASLGVAGEALAAAQEKLRLAEGRYRTGAGSALELSDAQLAATRAAGQVVQARFTLSTARAALLAALGSP